MDKPRPGGSRDDSRNTISMTREELIEVLADIANKHPMKQRPIELPPYYGDDEGRVEQ